jgi:putative membrane protein
MIKKLILSAGLVAALVFTVPAAFAQSKKSAADQGFLKEAMQGSLAEIQMGKLAQEKGNSADVRSFGKTLEQDHAKALQKAQDAARAAGMTTMPAEPAKKHKDAYGRMSKLSGADFDRQFVKHMVDDHKKDIRAHEKHAKDANAPVASYANEVLPDLRKHLEMAQSMSRAATTGSR